MKIAVLGCGNMAKAICLPMHQFDSSIEFITYTPSETRAIELAKLLNGTAIKRASDFPSDIDFWLIACKPQQFSDLCNNFANQLENSKIISIMAAIDTSKLITMSKARFVCRFMPSLASEIGLGVNLIFTQDASAFVKLTPILESCGELMHCKTDEMLNQLTVISASGPGFVFYLMNLFVNEAKMMGLDDKASKDLVTQLFSGSAILAKQKNESLQDLQNKVTSKAGVTIAAIEEFNRLKFPENFQQSIAKALLRSDELAKIALK